MSIIELDEGWRFIQKGMTKLKNRLEGKTNSRFTAEDYINLYTTVYNMCTQKPPHDYSQHLYAKFQEYVEEYIVSTVIPSLPDKHDEFMLSEFLKRWVTHKVLVKRICRFFEYLDRYYIPRHSLPPLNKVVLSCSPNLVDVKLKGLVWDAVISLIYQEREGRRIDRALLKNAVQVFDEVGTNYHDFEAHLLQGTAAYYSRKASNWIVEYSSPDYLLKAEECLKRENESASFYLQSRSVPKLMEKVRHELLFIHATHLLENEHSGWRALLRDNKVEDLSRMYRLLSRIPSRVGLIAEIFKQHVIAEGVALFKQAEDQDTASNEKVSVMEVVEFHHKHSEYVNEHFKGTTHLHKALKEAFENLCTEFVSKRPIAELLVTFCDNILKKGGSEKLSDEAIEGTFEKLLACIRDKDLFVEFYRRKLAHRVLRDKGANEDHERIVLSKLKRHFGNPLVSRLEGMLADLTLAREKVTTFDEYLNSNSNSHLGIDFRVTVQTKAFWPSCKPVDLNLPPEMARYVEVYREFYQTSTKKRKLSWIYSLGTCYIDGYFEPKTIELIVTTSQAAALVLFNASDRLSYSEIKAQLNLSDEDVSRLMHSLSCGKYKLLNKEPNTDTISPADSFDFNSKFTDTKTRIKLPRPFINEKNKVVEDVDNERRHCIEASIVRIMKSRKVLSQQELAMECAQQLSHICKPEHKVMMKRIEDLIDRDYLERDKDDPVMLKYLP